MSNCRDIEKDLSALIDGELPGERQAEVIEHVDHCPQCSRRVAELQKIVAGITALPAAQPPPQFLADVRRKLRVDKPTWVDTLFRPVWWKLPLEAMAAILVIAGIAILVQPAQRPAPVLAKAESAGRSAKILSSEPAEKVSPAAADRMLGVLQEPVSPPAASQPQVAMTGGSKLPELPETLVIRGDSVVTVRLRVENLAKELDGRVESGAPTNAFLVYLPQSKVAAFRTQVRGSKAAVSLAVAAKEVAPAKAEPVVGVKVVVEP
ncbi:MAG: zf-HC2 domain-containing protein [Verrucomicrobiota bacterium]